MKSPQQKLHTALNNLRIILQVATRPDLTAEELKLLKAVVKSFELSLAHKERQLAAQRMPKTGKDEII